MLPSTKTAFLCFLSAFSAPLSLPASAASIPDGRAITGSVRGPDPDGRSIGSARISRTSLTPAELSAPMEFSVSLRMRDFAGLQARVAAGERLTPEELEARYLPARGDYERVGAWLESQGLALTLGDGFHTTVFARGPASGVARAFGTRLARVAVSDGEYTSAVSEPVMPPGLAGAVLSVNGLQPQFGMRPLGPRAMPLPNDVIGNSVYIMPDNIASAYNIPPWATGAGQIIAIVGQARPIASDLPKFWSAAGVRQITSNFAYVDVNGGVGANPPPQATIEASIDAQWASSVAPGAAIRFYDSTRALDCLAQVLNDIPLFPNMSVLSISFGSTEGSNAPSVLQAYSQTLASIAALGVTVVASSGDCGTNSAAGIGSGNYSAQAPLVVSFPASDPSVTGIGGSKITFAGEWANAGEVVWDLLAMAATATGGGVSSVYPKPAWQAGNALLAAETMRCVPDVVAYADADLEQVDVGLGVQPYTAFGIGVLTYLNGTLQSYGGTSVSCPIWAGIAALINQGRAGAGLGPVGLLNPHIYPLAGTSAFHDIRSGTNGAYSAGQGYDLSSGLGSPNVANLIAALGGRQGDSHRLINLSARVQVGTASNIMIAGFVIKGPAGTTKDVLVRGIGPGLSSFGVAGVLANPAVAVYDTAQAPALIASNTGWDTVATAGNSAVAASFRLATEDDMRLVGAFALAPGSADSALVLTLPVGSYTVELSGVGATSGVALAEVYEVNEAPAELLANLSSRCFVGSGSQQAISGFVVDGNKPTQLLVRGIGPALANFGLSGTLERPTIGLYDSTNALIASNAGWENAPAAGTSTVAATWRQATSADLGSVGAFALPAGSADSALVVTVPPGSYTAIVSGAGGASGTALVEVYEMSGP